MNHPKDHSAYLVDWTSRVCVSSVFLLILVFVQRSEKTCKFCDVKAHCDLEIHVPRTKCLQVSGEKKIIAKLQTSRKPPVSKRGIW